MSYKSAWFDEAEVCKIARHFDITADYLFDQGRENLNGAYGCNIVNKLASHPLFSTAEIDEYMLALYRGIGYRDTIRR